MGADGHVYILDIEKVKELLGLDITEYVYKYEILGRKVAVFYYGDNFGYEWPQCFMCGSMDCMDDGHRKSNEEILKSPANLTQHDGINNWEVWT